MGERFWLSDPQWAAIEPLLPHLGGKSRVDDRRVISGILHRYRKGLRGRAIPSEYGPRTTLFDRFNRWSQRGLGQELLAALSACAEPPEVAMADSTTVRAHRSAAAAKRRNTARRSAAPEAAAPPRSTRSATARVASTP